MHNALNHIAAQRVKRPREQHVKIDARVVDEMLKDTHKLVDKLNASEQENADLKRRLQEKSAA